jgi:RimJ/RimL family protein N-acetyltransferase
LTPGGAPRLKTLQTKRLSLEAWNEQYREPWRTICRDPEVMRFIGAGEVWETAEADDVFDRMVAHWREYGFGWRSLLLKTTNAWLGFAGLNVVGPGVEGVAAEEVEIGWWLIRSAWGQGYATEAASAVRDEGFDRVGLDRLIARLQPKNAASARVAEKIGMTRERKATGRQGEALYVYCLDRKDFKRQLRQEQ